MRYLHLVYFFLHAHRGLPAGKIPAEDHGVALGAVSARLQRQHVCRAARAVQRQPIIWNCPDVPPANPWLQAFAWIRNNTPTDAYFALDPHYLEAPGEDYHSFRALAERSQLADAIKDTAVVTQVPELGPDWERQVEAQARLEELSSLRDFERLKAEFGVDWVLVSIPQPAGLDCRWHNGCCSSAKSRETNGSQLLTAYRQLFSDPCSLIPVLCLSPFAQ